MVGEHTSQHWGQGCFLRNLLQSQKQWNISLEAIPRPAQKFEALFHKYPPFFYSVGLNESLAFTSDIIEPHRNGFIFLDLNVLPPNPDYFAGLPTAKPNVKGEPSGSSPSKKRSAESPLEEQPSSKRRHASQSRTKESKAMEVAFKQLPGQP